jgi:hypothetical protein
MTGPLNKDVGLTYRLLTPYFSRVGKNFTRVSTCQQSACQYLALEGVIDMATYDELGLKYVQHSLKSRSVRLKVGFRISVVELT